MLYNTEYFNINCVKPFYTYTKSRTFLSPCKYGNNLGKLYDIMWEQRSVLHWKKTFVSYIKPHV